MPMCRNCRTNHPAQNFEKTNQGHRPFCTACRTLRPRLDFAWCLWCREERNTNDFPDFNVSRRCFPCSPGAERSAVACLTSAQLKAGGPGRPVGDILRSCGFDGEPDKAELNAAGKWLRTNGFEKKWPGYAVQVKE